LTPGAHQATVRAIDRSNNVASVSVAFNVDLTAPTITVLSPTSGSVVGTTTTTVSINVDDVGSGYHRDIIRVDGSLVKDSTSLSPISFSIELEDGVHRLTMISTDRAGNTANVNFQFTVNSGSPTVAILSPVEGSVVSTSDVVMEWTASDGAGLDLVEMSVDGGIWTDVTGQINATLGSLADGGHVIVLRATSTLGRTTTVWSNFTVDAIPLTASMKVAENVLRDGPVVIVFSKAVNASTLQWSAPFSGTISWQGNELIIMPAVPLDPGLEYAITVSISDIYGTASGPIELTFRTTDHGAITGTVRDPSGEPVAGARVTAPDGSFVLTAQNGSFSLSLPPGPVQLKIQKDGYNDLYWDVVVVPGEEASIGSKQLIASGGLGPFILPLVAVLVITTAVVLIAVARRRR
jgi:hypothetical protein